MHTINEMKEMTFKNSKKRHEILESAKSDEKLSFSIAIVEYNIYMNESDENAQQKSYYSSYRFDCRY